MAAHEDHGDAEPGEAAVFAENGPVASDDSLAVVDRELRPEQETGDTDDEGQGNIVEELESVGHLGEVHHDSGGEDYGQKDGEVAGTDDLKNYEGRALETGLGSNHLEDLGDT